MTRQDMAVAIDAKAAAIDAKAPTGSREEILAMTRALERPKIAEMVVASVATTSDAKGMTNEVSGIGARQQAV